MIPALLHPAHPEECSSKWLSTGGQVWSLLCTHGALLRSFPVRASPSARSKLLWKGSALWDSLHSLMCNADSQGEMLCKVCRLPPLPSVQLLPTVSMWISPTSQPALASELTHRIWSNTQWKHRKNCQQIIISFKLWEESCREMSWQPREAHEICPSAQGRFSRQSR